MVKTDSNECSMILVSKVFLVRVPSKRVPLIKEWRYSKGQKRSTRGSECFRWRGSVPMGLKGLTLEGEILRNPSVSLNPTLARNEKVEHYIRIKTHKPIALRFWVESGVSVLCGWAHVSLVLYLPCDTPSLKNLTCQGIRENSLFI